MEKNNINDHLEWIDVLKGIGIILVIIGHSIRDGMRTNMFFNNIYCFIYLFHMPLFFIISGYLLEKSIEKEQNIDGLINKKIITLLIPFIVYSFIIYFCFSLTKFIQIIPKNLVQYYSIKEYLLLCLLGKNPYAFHLWYIYVLFLIEICIILCSKMFSAISQKYLLVYELICSTILYLIASYIFPSGIEVVNMTLNLFMKQFVYLVVGQCIYYFKLDNKIKNIHFYGFFAGMILICYTLEKDYFFYKTRTVFNYNSILMLCVIIFVMWLINISKLIRKNRVLAFLGKNSFLLYLLHQPFCCAFVGEVAYTMLKFPAIICILICIICSIFFPIIFKKIIYLNRITRKMSKKMLNI